MARLWRRDLIAGHWAPLSHPGALARAVTELVDHLGGAPAGRELARAEVGVARGGIQFTPGPSFADIYSDTGFCFTEQDDIDGLHSLYPPNRLAAPPSAPARRR